MARTIRRRRRRRKNAARGRTIRKRCGKCGAVGFYAARERRCKCLAGLFGSYWCYGQLTPLPMPIRPTKEKEATMISQKASPQMLAQRKLEHARRKIAEKTAAMRRLATALHAWERKAAHYAKRASMTNAEIVAEKAARRAAEAKRQEARARRGIRFDGVA